MPVHWVQDHRQRAVCQACRKQKQNKLELFPAPETHKEEQLPSLPAAATQVPTERHQSPPAPDAAAKHPVQAPDAEQPALTPGGRLPSVIVTGLQIAPANATMPAAKQSQFKPTPTPAAKRKLALTHTDAHQPGVQSTLSSIAAGQHRQASASTGKTRQHRVPRAAATAAGSLAAAGVVRRTLLPRSATKRNRLSLQAIALQSERLTETGEPCAALCICLSCAYASAVHMVQCLHNCAYNCLVLYGDAFSKGETKVLQKGV